MNFNQTIIDKLDAILSAHYFVLTEQFKGSLKYENNGFYFSFTRDPREQMDVFWVGRHDGFPIEINNKILSEFFNSEIKIEQKTMDEFALNVYEFLRTNGMRLLQAKEQDYLALEYFSEKQSEEYTSEILERQYLDAANKAWEKKNYSDVLKALSHIDKNRLSISFKQKYKISKKRISH